MDTPRGLLVPVIREVQNKSIFDIAKELNELQQLGAKSMLTEQHLSGGTFTLSNIGSIGGTYASPILVVPQVCIGALGRTQTVPRFASEPVSGQPLPPVVATKIMNISWSGDHRIIDGATIARFSNAFKGYLEQPATMVAFMK